MKRIYRTFPVLAIGALLVLPSLAQAQGAPRAGSWEFILPVTYSPSKNVSGQGGSSADVNADLGFGFGFGYNLTNNFQMSGTVNWSNRSFNATIVNTDGTTKKASGNLDSSTIAFNGTYFFMPGRATPFVSGGIGSTFIDTNIPNGQGSTACWWDPWYGYICNSYASTKTYTNVSYTAGGGMRWALTKDVSMQASYNKLWIDATNAKPVFDGWRLDFIFRM